MKDSDNSTSGVSCSFLNPWTYTGIYNVQIGRENKEWKQEAEILDWIQMGELIGSGEF